MACCSAITGPSKHSVSLRWIRLFPGLEVARDFIDSCIFGKLFALRVFRIRRAQMIGNALQHVERSRGFLLCQD
jgi:hypothetical protein